MDLADFETTIRAIGERLTRRRLAMLAAGGVLSAAAAMVPGAAPVAARRRRRNASAEHNVRGRKAIMCVEGVTTRVPKKKRKQYLKQGATRGECAAGPVCTPGGAGSACSKTCGCATGFSCFSGICRVCTVTCASDQTAEQCGEELRTAISAGGDVYVCPGRYILATESSVSVSVYGTGNGADPAVDTILDANQSGSSVMSIAAAGATALYNLRVTGAHNSGLFISNALADVTIAGCVITENETKYGGGIYWGGGDLTISDSTISNNHGGDDGGGILAASSGVASITTTLFTGNTTDSSGGGILLNSGTVTLDSSVSITGNSASAGFPSSGGGVRVLGGTFNRNGAVISGNTPNDCTGVGC